MDMTVERIRVSGDDCPCIDEENRTLNLEVAVPGVKKAIFSFR
jgi:hypothetical protein